MDVGESQGGLPPDDLVEDMDAVLADTEGLHALHEERARRLDADRRRALLALLRLEAADDRVGGARAARWACGCTRTWPRRSRRRSTASGLFGCRPVEYLEQLGWLAGDVWCAHCVHLSDEDVQAFGSTGTGVAHCPTSNLRLGAGVAPVRAMIDAGRSGRPRRRRLGVERAQRPRRRT